MTTYNESVQGHEFIECDTCKAKPGMPILCDGCLHNRSAIEAAHKAGAQWMLQETEKKVGGKYREEDWRSIKGVNAATAIGMANNNEHYNQALEEILKAISLIKQELDGNEELKLNV